MKWASAMSSHADPDRALSLITALWTPLMLATRLFRDPYVVLGAELAGVVVIAAVRVVTVNVILPCGVLRHAASQLDRWVLYEKRPSEWPERRWSEAAET